MIAEFFCRITKSSAITILQDKKYLLFKIRVQAWKGNAGTGNGFPKQIYPIMLDDEIIREKRDSQHAPVFRKYTDVANSPLCA